LIDRRAALLRRSPENPALGSRRTGNQAQIGAIKFSALGMATIVFASHGVTFTFADMQRLPFFYSSRSRRVAGRAEINRTNPRKAHSVLFSSSRKAMSDCFPARHVLKANTDAPLGDAVD
jgi:hypothetical protein